MSEIEVTRADIDRAAIQWCSEKDRETFSGDIEYFKHNWKALNGLRSRVETLAAHRIAATAELEAENFALAAGQCCVKNGLLGDDHGHQYCALEAEVAHLQRCLNSRDNWLVEHDLWSEFAHSPHLEALSRERHDHEG